MQRRVASVIVAVLCVALGMLPSTPAKATGATDVRFTVNGTLPTFPCTASTGCSTTFSGTGSGEGNASAVVGSGTSAVAYDATFTITNGTVTGSAQYTEPAGVFCPAVGTAGNSPTTGLVTVSGGATGVVVRSLTPHFQGTVTGVTVTLLYSYHRVGVTPVVTITGGTVRVSYFFPVTGAGSFTRPILRGGGAGYFSVNTATAMQRCTTPGSLPFTVVGQVAMALS